MSVPTVASTIGAMTWIVENVSKLLLALFGSISLGLCLWKEGQVSQFQEVGGLFLFIGKKNILTILCFNVLDF